TYENTTKIEGDSGFVHEKTSGFRLCPSPLLPDLPPPLPRSPLPSEIDERDSRTENLRCSLVRGLALSSDLSCKSVIFHRDLSRNLVAWEVVVRNSVGGVEDLRSLKWLERENNMA
ncbi:hypothetical protein MUK42_34628, partial [Musa troglodytarum]